MDALRLLLNVTQSVTGCIPTQERGNDHLAGLIQGLVAAFATVTHHRV